MLKKHEFWILTVLALAVAALAGANMVLFHGNRGAQAEVAGRQQFIAQSVPLESFYREMVKALAELAVKAEDEQLRTLLADQGITIAFTPKPPAAARAGATRKAAK